MNPSTLKSTCIQLAHLVHEHEEDAFQFSSLAGTGGDDRTPEQAAHRKSAHHESVIAYGYSVAFWRIYDLLDDATRNAIDGTLEEKGIDAPSSAAPMPDVKWNQYGS